ncbi:MAG: ABC transporter substrate-binding protein [Candidatus Rokubacteria bacterium]|nr:ABC transporter substrate-binding protein [Candidatus Rokubacteria bacterium]MBI3825855.1 ABC transporter substrate-binding protein [Candidatus Rokubacteria bacterium]
MTARVAAVFLVALTLAPLAHAAGQAGGAQRLFDFGEISRRALGPHWNFHTPKEQDEFVRLFTDVLHQFYVTAVDRSAGDDIAFQDEKVSGRHAQVRARVTTARGTAIPLRIPSARERRWVGGLRRRRRRQPGRELPQPVRRHRPGVLLPPAPGALAERAIDRRPAAPGQTVAA